MSEQTKWRVMVWNGWYWIVWSSDLTKEAAYAEAGRVRTPKYDARAEIDLSLTTGH